MRRLTLKHSVWAVATWLKEQHLGGPAGRWSHHYWCKLLTPLAEQVRRAKEKVVRDERAGKTLLIPPMPEEVQNVLAEIITPASHSAAATPASAQQVWKHVEEVFQAFNVCVIHNKRFKRLTVVFLCFWFIYHRLATWFE